MNGQHGLTVNERHDANRHRSSNHSIKELLKKDSHPANEKGSAFSATNMFMVGSDMLSKVQPYFDIDTRRRRETFTDDIMMTRSNSFDGVPVSILHSPEFSYRNAHHHRDEYSRRPITPSVPTGMIYPTLLMSTAAHGDTRQRSKYTCRSAGSTPLSSPGPFQEKASFFADRYLCRGPDNDTGSHSSSSEFAQEHKVGFEDCDSYSAGGSTSTSPSKAFLKKQRDDGMER